MVVEILTVLSGRREQVYCGEKEYFSWTRCFLQKGFIFFESDAICFQKNSLL